MEKEFDQPKATKKSVIKDRLFNNPISTVIGLLLVGCSFVALSRGLDVTYCTLIGIAGLGMLGVKDPRVSS